MRPLLIAMLVAMGTTAFAQESDRFTLERRGDGWVRIDSRTGDVSTCEERDGQFICQLATDDRHVMEDEITALRERVEQLEKRLTAVEGEKTTADFPSDAELDRTLGFMEKFFRGFMGIVRELERDFGTPDKQPAPERT